MSIAHTAVAPATIHYYDSQYRPNLNEPSSSYTTTINLPQGHNRLGLYSISVPKSYYLIPAGYNVFTLVDQSDMTVYTITIPVGNYNIFELINQLNTLLSSPTNLHIVVSFSSSTGKMTWTTSSNRHYVSSFNTKLRKIFGFTSDPVFIHSNPPVVSSRIVNFQPLQSITIVCSLVQSNPNDYTSGILHQLLVNSSIDFSYIIFEAIDPQSLCKPIIVDTSNYNTPTSLKISLLDDDELPIELNGLDVLFQLYSYYEPPTNLPLTQYNLFRDWFDYQMRKDEEVAYGSKV